MKELSRALRWMIANLDWLIAIILSIVTSILESLQWITISQVISTTLLVLGLLSFSALRDRDTYLDLKRIVTGLEAQGDAIFKGEDLLTDKVTTGISRVFPQAVGFNWLSLIKNAKHVTIIRTRMDFGDDPQYYDAFTHILDEGGSVTLIMADPRSPEMWLRYMEEPKASHNPTAWTSGLENLANNAISLNLWMQQLASKGHDTSRLSIKLFPHYPAQAFYKFDSTLHVYHYSYKQRGIHAPMFVFNNSTTGVYIYFRDCINTIITSSIPLQDGVDEIEKMLHKGQLSDHIVESSRFLIANTTGP